MLMRIEDLSFTDLSLRSAFLIDDEIMCVADGNSNSFPMYSININTFAIKEVPVVYHDNIKYVNYPIVYKRKAYQWLREERLLISGAFDGDTFHWKTLKTINAPRMNTLDFCDFMSDETTSTITNIFKDDLSDQLYLCTLDLSTMIWADPTTINDASLVSANEDSLFVWTTKSFVHAIGDKHLVMEKSTNAWTSINRYIEKNDYTIHLCEEFKALDQLYCLGYHSIGDIEYWAIFRFDYIQMKWIKMNQIDLMKGFHEYFSEIVVANSRVFCIGGNYLNIEKLFVFELKPTLFDWAQAAVIKNDTCRTIAKMVLPREVVATTFRDESGDALVPKGGDRSDFGHAVIPRPTPSDEDEDEEEDASGIEERDIELVCSQANVTRNQAIRALRISENDIVYAIMRLTM